MSNRLRWLTRLAIVTALFALVGLLLLSLYASSHYDSARREFEHRIGPLRFNEFVLGRIPESDNAATWLLAGSRAVELETAQLGDLRRLARLPAHQWTVADSQAAESLLERNAEALELLDRSRTCSQATYDIDYTSGPKARIPPLLDLLAAARLALLEAKLGAAEGDLTRIRRGFEILERLAASLGRESTLITALVSFATTHLMLEATQELLLHPEMDSLALATLAEEIDALEPRNTLHRGIHAEATFVVSLPGDAGGHGGRPVLGRLERLAYRYSEDLFRASLLDEYRTLIESLHMPWNEIDLADRQGTLRPGFWARLSPLRVDLPDIISKLKEVESSQNLALEALSLRRRALADGRYPGSHPFLRPDSYGGKSFAYTLNDDGSATVSSWRARDLWQQRNSALPNRRQPRFVYNLPAAGPATRQPISDDQHEHSDLLAPGA